MHKNFFEQKLDHFCTITDNNLLLNSLRRGLLLSVPVFLLASMMLVFLNLPIPVYQEFIQSVFDGALKMTFYSIYFASMGILALILIVSISTSYSSIVDPNYVGSYIITCLICYIFFTFDINHDFNLTDFNASIFSPSWLFTAIIVTLICCPLLKTLLAYSKKRHRRHYHEGIDLDFQNTTISLFPIFICVTFFWILKSVFTSAFGSTSIQNIGSVLLQQLFEKIGTGLLGSFLFIFLIHFLWFFGIHGSNMLSYVSYNMFEAGLATNIMAVQQGGEPTVIFTKTFFDCFILMGGSGATICLLIALLFTSKRSSMKSLFRVALIPSIFNINELVLFGFPVIFNPIMLIPFLLVPLAMLCTSTIAMYIGLVPYCIQTVDWTTPILFSGYFSTQSIAGSLLQLFNLVMGVFIYLPFVKLSEQYYNGLLKRKVNNLQTLMIEHEKSGDISNLQKQSKHNLHDVIKLLTADLSHSLENHKLTLYYQPQFRSDGTLYGLEALLRWNHPEVGFIYPPLIVKLAQDEGFANQMGYQIIEHAAVALERISKEVKYPIHLAVNISPSQLEDPNFCKKVKLILTNRNFNGSTLCFEVVEQIALSSSITVQERIRELQEYNIPFHMDDFCMGHSSMIYLQNNTFSVLKLDGQLTREVIDNKQSKEIISSIYRMSESLHYDLIAEYIENEEQRNVLEQLGCEIYQGYLYSPALSLTDLEEYLIKHGIIENICDTPPTENELYM